MAKLTARGRKELFRFLSVKKGGIFAFMDDGTKLLRRPGSGWKVYSHKKAEVPLEEWIRIKTEFYESKVPKWRKIRSLPSVETIHKWMDKRTLECLSTLGEPCPFNHCDRANNLVSWLVALRCVRPSTLIIEELERGEDK